MSEITEKEFQRILKSAQDGDVDSQLAVASVYATGGDGSPKDDDAAFFWYMKAAEQGDAYGQAAVGFCYSEGLGVEPNERLGFSWYLKAAEQGIPEIQTEIGNRYMDGIGIEPNEKEAFSWYLRAAEQGYSEAQKCVGECYLNGFGTEQDDVKAFEWLLKAAEQGDAYSQNEVALCYRNGVGTEIDEHKAFYWFLQASNQEEAQGQYGLGECYAFGLGVGEDAGQAFKCYLKAAEQDLAIAQYSVGCCYSNGIGTQKDEKKAFEWYLKAAEQGLASAQCCVACCYCFGTGIQEDEGKAFYWFNQAAVQEYPVGQGLVGACYYYGIGIKKDYEKAVDWFLKAAKNNDAYAQEKLFYCYLDGKGIDQNFDIAKYWCDRGANQGSTKCKLVLALCLFSGKTIDYWSSGNPDHTDFYNLFMTNKYYPNYNEQNARNAFEMIEEAASQGDSDAQFFIGLFFAHGVVVEKNDSIALRWFLKSANRGNSTGMYLAGMEYCWSESDKNIEKGFNLIKKAVEEKGGLYEHIRGGGTGHKLRYPLMVSLSFLGRESESIKKETNKIFCALESDGVSSARLFIQLLNLDFSDKDQCCKLLELCMNHKSDSGGVAYWLLSNYYFESNDSPVYDLVDQNNAKAYYYLRKAKENGWIISSYSLDLFYGDKESIADYDMIDARIDWKNQINLDKVNKVVSDCFNQLANYFHLPLADFCKRTVGDDTASEYVFDYFDRWWNPEKKPRFLRAVSTSLLIAGIKRESSTYYDDFDSLSYKRDKVKNHFLKTLEVEGIILETLTTEELRKYIEIFNPSLGKQARERLFNSIVFPTKRFSVMKDDEGKKYEEEENSVGDKSEDDPDNLLEAEKVFGKVEFLKNVEKIVQELEKTQYVKTWVKRNPAIGTCVLASLLYEQIGGTFIEEDIIRILRNSEYFTYDIRPLFNLFEERGGKVATAKEICSLIGVTEENYSQRKKALEEKIVEVYTQLFRNSYYLD